MMTDKDLEELISCLRGPAVALRAATLRNLSGRPTKDPRLLPELERLLEDRSPCTVSMPLHIGEVCWLAARALLAERAAQGIDTTVRVAQVVRPQSVDELADACNAADLQSAGGLAGSLQAFAQLRAAGRLPTYDFSGDPAITRRYRT
jgi:hypothetical protein